MPVCFFREKKEEEEEWDEDEEKEDEDAGVRSVLIFSCTMLDIYKMRSAAVTTADLVSRV